MIPQGVTKNIFLVNIGSYNHKSQKNKLLQRSTTAHVPTRSTGDLSTSIPLAILMFFQLYFLTDVAGLRPDYAGWAIGASRLWDAVNDPLFGLLSDRLRTRWGRRRVLLLFGAVPLGVFFMLMWIVPALNQTWLAVYYAMTFILFDTAFTIVHVGYNALTPEMTSDYDERSALNGYRMVFSISGTLGAIILATVLGWSISDARVLYLILGIGLGLISMIPPLVVFSVTRERAADTLPKPLPLGQALRQTLGNHPFRMVMGLYLLSWTTASILAAVLARRGIKRVVATDQDARALQCATENARNLGLTAAIEVIEADLFPDGRAPLVVCNPPWVPAQPSSPVEYAVYDPDSRMLRGFLAGLAAHLEPNGEGWLIISDLAEHLGLRSRDELLGWIAAAGLQVRGRIDTRPRHPKASDRSDPLHVARAAEVTSLWRLAAAGC